MPRTLPWLANAVRKKEAKKPKASSSPLPKRGRDSSEDLVDADLNAIGSTTPERKPKKRANRTPSTSPPPAPPDVDYMREGYNADDIYMMVEDEFLSTAKVFTQHIHHAEYVRLKKLAKSRGAGTLQAIARPIDGTTEQSNGLKMKLEAAEKQEKIRASIKTLDDDEGSSDDDDEYMQDPQLAGLMMADSQAKKDLSGLTKARSNTRAAAGFSQSPRNVERKRNALIDNVALEPTASSSKVNGVAKDEVYYEGSDDDLDAAPSKFTRPIYAKAERGNRDTSGSTESETKFQNKASSDNSRIFKRFTDVDLEHRNAPVRSGRKQTNGSFLDTEVVTESTDNGGPTNRSTQPAAASVYLAKRRAEKDKKDREEKRKAKRVDDIPTFLI